MCLIVEGLSEQVVVNYLVKTGDIKTDSKGVFVLESVGKYNIPRFMNLLGELHIQHVVLYDVDSSAKNKRTHDALNKLIQESKNACTRGIDCLPENLESTLGVDLKGRDRWKKAAQILMAIQQGKVTTERLDAFKTKIEALVSSLAAR